MAALVNGDVFILLLESDLFVTTILKMTNESYEKEIIVILKCQQCPSSFFEREAEVLFGA